MLLYVVFVNFGGEGVCLMMRSGFLSLGCIGEGVVGLGFGLWVGGFDLGSLLLERGGELGLELDLGILVLERGDGDGELGLGFDLGVLVLESGDGEGEEDEVDFLKKEVIWCWGLINGDFLLIWWWDGVMLRGNKWIVKVERWERERESERVWWWELGG